MPSARRGDQWSALLLQAYTRLHRRGLARTITTNFHNPGSGRFLHYQQHRTLTVREAARLQGFGDDFVFIGRPGRQERLVGNAFPPLWAGVHRRSHHGRAVRRPGRLTRSGHRSRDHGRLKPRGSSAFAVVGLLHGLVM